jgi:hypothetical protein
MEENKNTETKELSHGEKIVRSEFNPSGVGNVNYFKNTCANMINCVKENEHLDPRLAAIAITKIEETAMWCAKLATTGK